MLRIGIDVGGTNTDAVLLRNDDNGRPKILSSVKCTTTPDVTAGILAALRCLIAGREASAVDVVSIGTTHFINAVLQRRRLARVSVIRLGRPSSGCLAAFADWPAGLRAAVRHDELLAAGGFNYDGSVITELQQEEIKEFARQSSSSGCQRFAIVGIFAPINAEQELQVASWVSEAVPSASFTLSHQIGQIGFLERENATILNESLKPLCSVTLRSFEAALREAGIKCPLLLTQNDGTVAPAAECRRTPVLLIGSGATNSMRGAAHVTGLRDAIVADIGGTSTDVGLLIDGFPKPASARVSIGGVSTNFPIPDVSSIALGGGSVVAFDEADGSAKVGPESVGFRIRERAIAFGGDQLTPTDATAGCLRLDGVGDWRLVRKRFDDELLLKVRQEALRLLEDAVEASRVDQKPLPLVLVGGGSILFCDLKELNGLPVSTPEHAKVANAIGAALCEVGATVEATISQQQPERRQSAAEELKAAAVEAAIARGACRRGCSVADFQEIQLPYVPGGACRLTAKAVGQLDVERAVAEFSSVASEEENAEEEQLEEELQEEDPVEGPADADDANDLAPRPREADADGAWVLSRYDAHCLSVGSGLLGCGGGGSPRVGLLMLLQLLDSGRRPRVVSLPWLRSRHSPDATVVSSAFMGSPTILVEKLPSGSETSAAVRQLGIADISAVTAVEIGGMNSIEPLLTSARLDVPVLDADGMGRAFPELQMLLAFICGRSASPAALADEFGRSLLLTDCEDPKELERQFRVECVSRGCSIGVSLCPLKVADCDRLLIAGSYSRAWAVGDCVLRARRSNESPLTRLCSLLNAVPIVVSGKIVDVQRLNVGGFARGSFLIGSGSRASVRISFQNEYLLAVDAESERVLASTPDLIVLMDADSGQPITTEELRYGLRVSAMAVASDPKMATPQALRFVGPEAFGLDGVEYQPCAEFRQLQLEAPVLPS